MMPDESYSAVRSTVWPVFLSDTANRELKTFQSNTKAFRDGGRYAQQGQNAVVLLTVPALAIILSVIGMLFHSAKILYYAQEVLTLNHLGTLRRISVAFFISACVACLFYFWTNDITQAPLYHHLIAAYQKSHREGHGIWPAWMLTWIIQAERLVYPVADFLRQHVLSGYHFGVTPLSQTA